MMDPHDASWNYFSAMFGAEFLDGGVDYDSIEALHRGDVQEWVRALEQSGLFDRATIDDVASQWRIRPSLLLDMFLESADEVTVRRCRMAWASLDRLAPLVAGLG